MRQEFKRSITVARIKASTVGGVVYCNQCKLPCTRFHLDHIKALNLALNTEDLKRLCSYENSQLLCIDCHKAKTAEDVAVFAKATRIDAKHLGVPTRKRKIQSRSFPPSEAAVKRLNADKLPMPPRRAIYEDN